MFSEAKRNIRPGCTRRVKGEETRLPVVQRAKSRRAEPRRAGDEAAEQEDVEEEKEEEEV